jgi:dimethylglycine dehydrogenase
MTNYFVACGVMAGFSQGGGVGLALANWIVDGDPGFDVFGMDVARYGDWTTLGHTNIKVRENYSRRFRIRFPNEELPAGRPFRTTPIYDRLKERHAVFGDMCGLEHPLWFAPSAAEAEDHFSFRRSNDFPHVAREVETVRARVGMIEIANFAKYDITGPGAEAWLDHLLPNRLPKAGRMVLTPMLNRAGMLIGDFTLARLADDHFMIFGSGLAEEYHRRWFQAELPASGVSVRAHGLDLVGLHIAGPRARDVLAGLANRDVSASAFKFMDIARMNVGPLPALIGRVSYTGDLGYEIWVKPEHQRALFDLLMAAGAAHGIGLFGARAFNSLRLEKSFGSWSREYRPIYTPWEAGLDRFVSTQKADFIGRDALMSARDAGQTRRIATFVVDAHDADVIGDEPIWRDGKVVGWVTSGGYAHHSKASVAIGYVETAAFDPTADYEIEIIGDRRPARMRADPLFDAKGERMRG